MIVDTSKISCLRLCIFIFVSLLEIEVETSSIFNSAYAKVAKWGASSIGEGRSNGQSLFTQRSDVKLRSGQNLDKPKEVVYHYSMPAHKIISTKVDAPTKSPGFQDRFNPPPAFQFGDSKRNVPDHNHGVIYPADTSKQVSYNSPISSYNPVASGLPSQNPKFNYPGPVYPPFGNSPSPPSPVYNGPLNPNNENNNNKGNDNKDTGIDYIDNNDSDNDSKDTDNGGYQYNIPTSLSPNDGYHYDPPKKPPMNEGYHYNPPISSTPPSSPMSTYGNPKFPPYVYEHSDDTIINHPPLFDHKPDNHNHHDHDHHHEEEEGQPDNPEQQPDYQDFPQKSQKPQMDKIPEYMDEDPSGKFNYPLFSSFYGDHHDHHDHHVYHPVITTTTTTQAPEREDENRVNKGHYSYYYLGRKLYYVPLYFSVYFIIYITVLILKSIARHKVNFVHDLDNVNKGRSLDDDNSVEDIAERTTTAINSFKRRYIAL